MKYFDELDETSVGDTTSFNDNLCIRDSYARNLFLFENISDEKVAEITQDIIRFNHDDAGKSEDARIPIVLYISSDGGDVYGALQLYDIICASATPVYTFVLGKAFSSAFFVSIAGQKRFALTNSVFMWHDGYETVASSHYKAKDIMEWYTVLEAKMNNLIINRTKLTSDILTQYLHTEWYFTAEDALKYGVIDEIRNDFVLEDRILHNLAQVKNDSDILMTFDPEAKISISQILTMFQKQTND